MDSDVQWLGCQELQLGFIGILHTCFGGVCANLSETLILFTDRTIEERPARVPSIWEGTN